MATVYIYVDVTCPYCDSRDHIEVEALVDSGGVPQNPHRCYKCSRGYTVEAVLDMSVIPEGGHD